MSDIVNHPNIQALVNGDQAILLVVYQKVYPKVLKFVRSNKGNEEDAEETFHNALYQLIVRAKVKGVQINSSFEAYIFTVCKNLWYQELNKRKNVVRNQGVFELQDRSVDHTAQILQQERWDLFEEKIQLLSDNCRKLLTDYFNKVSYDEILAKFSYSTKNVAFQRIFKCKKKLTELVKKDNRFKNL